MANKYFSHSNGIAIQELENQINFLHEFEKQKSLITNLLEYSDCLRQVILGLSNKDNSSILLALQSHIEILLSATHINEFKDEFPCNIYPSYDVRHMISAEALFSMLDIVETIKYSRTLVEMRPAIIYYTNNSFDLNSILTGFQNSIEKNNIPLTLQHDINDCFNGKKLSFDKSSTTAERKGGISEDRLKAPNLFLQYIIDSVNGHYPYPFDIIIPDDRQESAPDYSSKKHYRLPYIQIPEFLLWYTYYSGKSYVDPNDPYNKSHYFKEAHIFNKQAFINTFNIYLAFMGKDINNNDILNNPLKIIQKYRIEKLLHYNQIIYLSKIKSFINGTDFNDIVSSFLYRSRQRISDYNDDIKSTLFSDKRLMRSLLSNCFINPSYLLLHSLYNYYVHRGSYKYDSVKSLLDLVKIETVRNINYMPLLHYSVLKFSNIIELKHSLDIPSLFSNSSLTIDVSKTENDILNKIAENPYAKDFLLSNHSTNDFETALNNISDFCSYDELRDAITKFK